MPSASYNLYMPRSSPTRITRLASVDSGRIAADSPFVKAVRAFPQLDAGAVDSFSLPVLRVMPKRIDRRSYVDVCFLLWIRPVERRRSPIAERCFTFYHTTTVRLCQDAAHEALPWSGIPGTMTGHARPVIAPVRVLAVVGSRSEPCRGQQQTGLPHRAAAEGDPQARHAQASRQAHNLLDTRPYVVMRPLGRVSAVTRRHHTRDGGRLLKLPDHCGIERRRRRAPRRPTRPRSVQTAVTGHITPNPQT
jgi:hypothetical protein